MTAAAARRSNGDVGRAGFPGATAGSGWVEDGEIAAGGLGGI